MVIEVPMLDHDIAVKICAAHFRDILSKDQPEPLTAFAPSEGGSISVVGPTSPPSARELWNAPKVWVNAALVEFRAHEALLAAAKALDRNGKDLPRPIELWLISLALGAVMPPAPPKREVSDTTEGLVYHSVAALIIHAKLSAMRNPSLGANSPLPEERSACDVVARAFMDVRRALGVQLPSSYERVRKIWQQANRTWKFDADEYRLFAEDHPSGIWLALQSGGK
jgi:hypothetical protein